MIGIQPIHDMVELTLQSNFLKPYIPVSLILIAKPETAKTTALSFTCKNDFVYYTNEITAKKLIDNVLPDVERGEIKCLVIPDLLNCVEKQKSTRQQFLMFIKSAIEEGFTEISTYHKQYRSKKPIKFSMITAITSGDFMKSKRYLDQVGLTSRFVPFSYDYPISKVKYILDAIENEEAVTDVKYNIIKKVKVVAGNKALFKNFEMISTSIAQQYGGHGFRAQIRLQQLAKANALLNKRVEVLQEDIDKIIELTNWMNFNFNNI